MEERHVALSLSSFSSPFSLPLDLFFRYSKFLKSKKGPLLADAEAEQAQVILVSHYQKHDVGNV
jgi:hypothetical protein